VRDLRTPEEVITTTDSTPPPIVDLQEAATRNRTARHIVAGFSTAAPTLAEIWRQLEAALADTPALSAEITRLRAELAGTRLDRANLLAAARAVITAHLDGESDPLAYLRDELQTRGQLPADPGSRL
jgi:CelD/BcsL family acetyltransferase involved in cellulose biosynthesis